MADVLALSRKNALGIIGLAAIVLFWVALYGYIGGAIVAVLIVLVVIVVNTTQRRKRNQSELKTDGNTVR